MTALDHRCEVCNAKPGQPCRNTIQPKEPLPGRATHYARTTKATATEREPLNDACY
jgi:hypothetical protein